jgi:hypothetical protein
MRSSTVSIRRCANRSNKKFYFNTVYRRIFALTQIYRALVGQTQKNAEQKNLELVEQQPQTKPIFVCASSSLFVDEEETKGTISD